MASQESNTNRPAPGSGDPHSDYRAVNNSHQRLSELAGRVCAANAGDALCFFLRLHECVCEKVSASRFPHMIELIPIFTHKCVGVCEEFLDGGDLANRSITWVRAFTTYMKQPQKVARTLSLMATAHIVEDLALSLFELEATIGTEIDRSQYEGVFEFIVECLVAFGKELGPSENLEDLLALNLAQHMGLFKGIGKFRIRSLRRKAWEEYQIRRKFRRGQASKGNESNT